jgi:Flp pilus assembly protein TadD
LSAAIRPIVLIGLFFICATAPNYPAAEGSKTPPPPAIDLDQLEGALTHERLIQAKAMIAAAVLARQNSPRLDLLTADYTMASGQTELASVSYQALVSYPAFKARAAEGAGIAAFKLGHDKEAYKFLKMAVDTDASRARAWDALGVMADKKQDWISAKKAYRAARAADPDNPAILNNMGYSLLLQHRFSEAIEVFKSALALRPGDDKIKTNISLALALNGQYAEAIGNEDDAPLLSRRLNNAGVAAHLRHDDEAAIAFLSRAIEISDVYNEIAANNLNRIRNTSQRRKP